MSKIDKLTVFYLYCILFLESLCTVLNVVLGHQTMESLWAQTVLRLCCIVCTRWTQPPNKYPHYSVRLTRSWCTSRWRTFDRISTQLMCLRVRARCGAPPLSPADAAHVLGPTWRGPRPSAHSNLDRVDLRVFNGEQLNRWNTASHWWPQRPEREPRPCGEDRWLIIAAAGERCSKSKSFYRAYSGGEGRKYG